MSKQDGKVGTHYTIENLSIGDLIWTSRELLVSGEDRIVVRGEASGTPIRPFFGGDADESTFVTMASRGICLRALRRLIAPDPRRPSHPRDLSRQ